jgi:phosphate transport system substrate-binding protein
MQFPAVLGGVVPIFNIDGYGDKSLILSGQALADIFLGKISRWNDPAIASLNPGASLPDAPINPVYRSDSSGTSAIFTNYLAKVSNQWASDIGAGKSVDFPAGQGAKGNDGVAANVKRIKNSIGYVEYAYAIQSQMPVASLINAAGKTIAPSLDSFAAAGQAQWDRAKDYYIWLVNDPGEGSWPIVGATFILVKKDRPESAQKTFKFFSWCFDNGDEEARSLHYVPLPASLKDDIKGYWKN